MRVPAWSAVLSVGVVLALLGAGGRDPVGTTRHPVASGLSLARGRGGVLVHVRGRYGDDGRLLARCLRSGEPLTTYAVSAGSADTVTAVDGRGVSRAADVLPGRRLSGGRGSGLERWVASMSREPEDLRLDVTVVALRAGAHGPSCEVSATGTLTHTVR
jgi:hypothetical protein